MQRAAAFPAAWMRPHRPCRTKPERPEWWHNRPPPEAKQVGGGGESRQILGGEHSADQRATAGLFFLLKYFTRFSKSSTPP